MVNILHCDVRIQYLTIGYKILPVFVIILRSTRSQETSVYNYIFFRKLSRPLPLQQRPFTFQRFGIYAASVTKVYVITCPVLCYTMATARLLVISVVARLLCPLGRLLYLEENTATTMP